MNAPQLSLAIREAMLTADPSAKVMATRNLVRLWRAGELAFAFDHPMPDVPARPEKPELLPPNAMPTGGSRCSMRWRTSNSWRSTSRWMRRAVLALRWGARSSTTG